MTRSPPVNQPNCPDTSIEMLSATGKEAPLEYREIVEKYYKRLSDYYEKRARRGK